MWCNIDNFALPSWRHHDGMSKQGILFNNSKAVSLMNVVSFPELCWSKFPLCCLVQRRQINSSGNVGRIRDYSNKVQRSLNPIKNASAKTWTQFDAEWFA